MIYCLQAIFNPVPRAPLPALALSLRFSAQDTPQRVYAIYGPFSGFGGLGEPREPQTAGRDAVNTPAVLSMAVLEKPAHTIGHKTRGILGTSRRDKPCDDMSSGREILAFSPDGARRRLYNLQPRQKSRPASVQVADF